MKNTDISHCMKWYVMLKLTYWQVIISENKRWFYAPRNC